MPKSSDQPPDDALTLPHWARVAFAGRCAQFMVPVLSNRWPNLDAQDRATLEAGVELILASASDGKATPGLKQARTIAARLANRAEAGIETPDGPLDGMQAELLGNAANAVARALQAAAEKPSGSALLTAEAHDFARSVLRQLGDKASLQRLDQEQQRLAQRARKKNMTDDSPVTLAQDVKSATAPDKDKPWWKIW